jgi:hypothetical protein
MRDERGGSGHQVVHCRGYYLLFVINKDGSLRL